MARTIRPKPHDLTPSWPDIDSDDPIGEVARLFAVNLRAAIGDRSVRAVARDTGVTHATILGILAGDIWPDFVTMARLEFGLQISLWPGRTGTLVGSLSGPAWSGQA